MSSEEVSARARVVGGWNFPCTLRIDYTTKVRFTATLGEEPEVEVALF